LLPAPLVLLSSLVASGQIKLHRMGGWQKIAAEREGRYQGPFRAFD
jgi:hypothetical protein